MALPLHCRVLLYSLVGLFGCPTLAHARDTGASSEDYRVGDKWDKEFVTEEGLFEESETFTHAAQAVARYGDMGFGTAFYLGQHAGYDIVATNHHVQPSMRCGHASAYFPFAHRSYSCRVVLASWPEVDLALVGIRIPDSARPYFEDIARSFAFKSPLRHSQPLMTLGFGVAANRYHELTVDRSHECTVFSGDDEYRLMADPDDYNPGPYRAWSFAHGCDISHGDSGSPMLDRDTGEVVGILWTGAIPKVPEVQDSAYLDRLLRHPNEDTWTKLGYAVPAASILERMQKALEDPKTGELTRKVIGSIVERDFQSEWSGELDPSGSKSRPRLLQSSEAGDRP